MGSGRYSTLMRISGGIVMEETPEELRVEITGEITSSTSQKRSMKRDERYIKFKI